jgi:hypothetical protein
VQIYNVTHSPVGPHTHLSRPSSWSFTINHKGKERAFQFWCTGWSEEALKFLTILALLGYSDFSGYLRQYASSGFPKGVTSCCPCALVHCQAVAELSRNPICPVLL